MDRACEGVVRKEFVDDVRPREVQAVGVDLDDAIVVVKVLQHLDLVLEGLELAFVNVVVVAV